MAYKGLSLFAIAILASQQEVKAKPTWDLYEAIERTGHGSLLERDIHCVSDFDCCEYCLC